VLGAYIGPTLTKMLYLARGDFANGVGDTGVNVWSVCGMMLTEAEQVLGGTQSRSSDIHHKFLTD